MILHRFCPCSPLNRLQSICCNHCLYHPDSLFNWLNIYEIAMISLEPISVEEMVAPRSQQRGVWTGTGRLNSLTWVWLTQLQAVSEGKYGRWISSDPNDVRVQTKVRLTPKVGSRRTEDSAQDTNVAGTSCLIENRRQDLSLLNERGHKERIHGMTSGFPLRGSAVHYNPDRFVSFNVHWKYFIHVCYPLSFTDPTNLRRSPDPS